MLLNASGIGRASFWLVVLVDIVDTELLVADADDVVLTLRLAPAARRRRRQLVALRRHVNDTAVVSPRVARIRATQQRRLLLDSRHATGCTSLLLSSAHRCYLALKTCLSQSVLFNTIEFLNSLDSLFFWSIKCSQSTTVTASNALTKNHINWISELLRRFSVCYSYFATMQQTAKFRQQLTRKTPSSNSMHR